MRCTAILVLTCLSNLSLAATRCDVDFFSGLLGEVGVAESAKVVYATPIPAGGSSFDPSPPFSTNETDLPELCAVKVEVKSSENSSYRFAVFLPTDWNDRMMTNGNGGFGGGINYMDMGHFAHYGFATVSTDTGHLSASGDGSWALNAPESIIDWGYRAMHGTVILSKQLISQYYESEIKYSYYAGCSTGGRQGLKEMQISPNSFDGILAGAPAWWTTHLQSWTTWYPGQNLPESEGYIPASLFPALATAINTQCDPQDGSTDNITHNPNTCTINYTALNLTTPQVETVQTLLSPWTDPTTHALLFPSLSPGALLNLADPLAPNPLGYDFYTNFIYNLSQPFNFRNFSLRDLEVADATNPGAANADDFAAILKYKKRGGKLIMYHGWSDEAIPAGSSVLYYNKTVEALRGSDASMGGGDGDLSAEEWPDDEGRGAAAHGRHDEGGGIDDFFRLFMVPNMGHCSGSRPVGSDAPWWFAAAGQALSGGGSGARAERALELDEEGNALRALMRWVEEGVSPERLVVRKFEGDDGAKEVVRRGVVCKWPEREVMGDGGDVRGVEGWRCEN